MTYATPINNVLHRRTWVRREAEFGYNPLNLLPAVKYVKTGWTAGRRGFRAYRAMGHVDNPKRAFIAGATGARRVMNKARILPGGVGVHATDAAGRRFVRSLRSGVGYDESLSRAGRAYQDSVRGSMRRQAALLKPAIEYGRGFSRANRMLGDTVPGVNRFYASNAVGVRQGLKSAKWGQKFYGYDKKGRRIVRSVRHKGRKLTRRFKPRSN